MFRKCPSYRHSQDFRSKDALIDILYFEVWHIKEVVGLSPSQRIFVFICL